MYEKLLAYAPGGINLRLNWLTLALIIIPIFTFFSGFLNSVNVENESTNFWECSFLGEPADRHADLIKGALSLYSGPPLETWDWPSHYRMFYEHNFYGKMEDVPGGRLTLFSLPPLTLLAETGVLQGILWMGPLFVVAVHYIIAWLVLGFLCCYFIVDRRERIFAFVSLALSYPFLVALLSGNYPPLYISASVTFYIYFACNRKHFVGAAVLLALACCMRPNAVLLAPLLLCFGFRKSIAAFGIVLATASFVTLISYEILTEIYPGYSTKIFSQALANYSHFYIDGALCTVNNSAAYGAIKIFCKILIIELTPDDCAIINESILCIIVGLIAWSSYRFWRGHIPAYHFALALACLYILGSTVIYAYHLLVLYAFIFLAGGRPSGVPYSRLFIFIVVGIIIPKSYFFIFPYVSPEGIFNVLILSACVGWILISDFSSNSEFGSLACIPRVETRKKSEKHIK